MNLRFKHDSSKFSTSLSFTSEDLPEQINDAFNKALDNDKNTSKSQILEATMLELKNKGLILSDQDLFNAAFILGGELREVQMKDKLKEMADKISRSQIPELVKNLPADEIINTESLLELAERDTPDDF